MTDRIVKLQRRMRSILRVLVPAAALITPVLGGGVASASTSVVAGTYSVQCPFGFAQCSSALVPSYGSLQVDGQTYTGLINENWLTGGVGSSAEINLELDNAATGVTEVQCLEAFWPAPPATSSVTRNKITFSDQMGCWPEDGSNGAASPAELSTTIYLVPGGLAGSLSGLYTATYSLQQP